MKNSFSLLAAIALLSASTLYGQNGGGDVASKIKSMEDQWEAAVAKKADGIKTVEGYIAEDFVGVSAKGQRLSKAQELSQMRKDTDTFTSTKNNNLKVTVYSSNVAVAMGDALEKGKGKDGASFDRVYRFTDTWVQRNGKWQCVASQIALVHGTLPK